MSMVSLSSEHRTRVCCSFVFQKLLLESHRAVNAQLAATHWGAVALWRGLSQWRARWVETDHANHRELRLMVLAVLRRSARSTREHTERSRMARLLCYRLSLERAFRAFFCNLAAIRVPDHRMLATATARQQRYIGLMVQWWSNCVARARCVRAQCREMVHRRSRHVQATTFQALCAHATRMQQAVDKIQRWASRTVLCEWRCQAWLLAGGREAAVQQGNSLRLACALGAALAHWRGARALGIAGWYALARGHALWASTKCGEAMGALREQCQRGQRVGEVVAVRSAAWGRCAAVSTLESWRTYATERSEAIYRMGRAVSWSCSARVGRALRCWQRVRARVGCREQQTAEAFRCFSTNTARTVCLKMIGYSDAMASRRTAAASTRICAQHTHMLQRARISVQAWKQGCATKREIRAAEPREPGQGLEAWEARLRWLGQYREKHRIRVSEQRRLERWLGTEGVGMAGTMKALEAQRELRALKCEESEFEARWPEYLAEVEQLQRKIIVMIEDEAEE